MKISRGFSGMWGVAYLALGAVILVGLLDSLGLPGTVVWGAAVFLVLLLALRIVSAIRGSAETGQGFSAFESNALGEPVSQTFVPPFHQDLPFRADEAMVARAAPIMRVAGGWRDLFRVGSVSFLGKGKVNDGENALILTNRRLMFLMIGPEEVLRRNPGSRLVSVLESLPGDAGAKRRMLWQHGEEEVRRTLAALVAEQSLEDLAKRFHSFTIPLDRISSVSFSPQSRTISLEVEGRGLHYSFKAVHDLTELAQIWRKWD